MAEYDPNPDRQLIDGIARAVRIAQAELERATELYSRLDDSQEQRPWAESWKFGPTQQATLTKATEQAQQCRELGQQIARQLGNPEP